MRRGRRRNPPKHRIEPQEASTVESTRAGPYRRLQATQGHHFPIPPPPCATWICLARPAWRPVAGRDEAGHRDRRATQSRRVPLALRQPQEALAKNFSRVSGWDRTGSLPCISRPSSGACSRAAPLRKPLRNLPCRLRSKRRQQRSAWGMPAAWLGKRQLAEPAELFQGVFEDRRASESCSRPVTPSW